MAPAKFKINYFVYLAVLATFSGASLLACGSNTSSTVSSASPTGSASASLIYPMYIDSNANNVNDYFEEATHDPGSPVARATGMGSYGHGFIDSDKDGICDYAQNGSSTWHGPGFVDMNSNGMSDYWDKSSASYNMGGGMQYIDANGNNINDYMEQQTHQGYGHDFVDNNGDGVCDYAQNGEMSAWHGPGYVDADGNGMPDHWQVGHDGNGGMMSGGSASSMM